MLAATFVATFLALPVLAPASPAKLKGYSTPVDLPGAGVGNPEIAVDANGRATIVWVNGRRINAVRLNQAGKPGPVRILSRAARTRAPKVAVDPLGRATVVWRRVDGVNDSIEAVRISAAGKPGPVRRVSGADEGPPIVYRVAPQIAVDPQGRATVVGRHVDDVDRIEAVRISPAGNPAPVKTLFEATGGGGAGDPQVAVAPDGRVTAVWRSWDPPPSGDSTNSRVQAVRLDAAGTPAPVQTLSEADATEPEVAVDPDGRATVVWRRATGVHGAGTIEAVRLDSGGEPGPVQSLAEISRHPEVAVDPDGRSTVVWRGWDGSRSRVQAVRLDAAGSPGPVRALSEAGMNAAGTPQVAVDPHGRATVVWHGHGIRAVRLDAAGDPGPVHKLARGARHPRVAVDPDGRATVVWDLLRGQRSDFRGVQAAHSVRLFAVRAKPRRRTVGPRRKQVRYRFRAANRDTEPSGVVRLCAEAPARRVRILGKRCRIFEDVEPGARVRRVVRVRPLGRARGQLTRIRLRARGPNVEAGTRALLKVKR